MVVAGPKLLSITREMNHTLGRNWFNGTALVCLLVLLLPLSLSVVVVIVVFLGGSCFPSVPVPFPLATLKIDCKR